MSTIRTLIMGAAGRDFHNFNVLYRKDDRYEVVAFTATQIPHISDRRYPAELAGPFYPKGIPIFDESELPKLIRSLHVQQVVFSYSDVSHEDVMHKASLVNACGADFVLIGPERTMLKSSRHVISVTAVRTGCGKSQTVQELYKRLLAFHEDRVAIRHPMPYGDLVAQKVQRFQDYTDLDKHNCTIEEREEYEPYVERNRIVYAGVDYEAILAEAEKEAQFILWDGGNNDAPFIKPDLSFVVVDPLRPGHELLYHPGETNLRMADVVVINKVDSATPEQLSIVEENIRKVNPTAKLLHANSPVYLDGNPDLTGKTVLVIEDGPTLTHGGMKTGAGVVAAQQAKAARILSPVPFATGEIRETFQKYPHVEQVLPAMGYGPQQIRDLQATIDQCEVDAVIIGTPMDLRRLVHFKVPAYQCHYSLECHDEAFLTTLLSQKFHIVPR